jgi:hypothetical protein
VASFTLAIVQISIPDEEEVSSTLTPKGVNNNIMVSLINSPRRRRRPAKKATPAATARVIRNSQVSSKRALNEYQNQLVARPAIPISNSFFVLRIVAKNSANGQLHQARKSQSPHRGQLKQEMLYAASVNLKPL